jgi:FkbM family methyltransferase
MRTRMLTLLMKAAARISGTDLLTAAYHDIGILKYSDADVSGEMHLIRKVLGRYLPGGREPVFFDVGANVGTIALLLREAFPAAEIWAFEPNRSAYDILSAKASGLRIACVNIGLGNARRSGTLYLPTAENSSSSATSHKGLHDDFYHTADVREIPFEMHTIDQFCSEHDILSIDFLKVDTEGNELSVLEGARRMLSEKRVGVIQFEFGECHVYSRTFLRDFYELLAGFRFFRLDSRRLIPLGSYHVGNEIFRFQNIVAIRGDGPAP